MALAAVKTFVPDEVLYSADLNAMNTNILNNGLSLVSPWTGNMDAGGYRLTNLSAGSVSDPSIYFSNDADTGIYRVGADQLGFATSGTVRLTLTGTSLDAGTNLPFVPGAVSGTPVPHALYRSNVVKAFAKVTIVGTTPTLGANFNALSASDDGVGQFTITWDRSFSASTYSMSGMATDGHYISFQALNTGSTQFIIRTDAGSAADIAGGASVIICGAQ